MIIKSFQSNTAYRKHYRKTHETHCVSDCTRFHTTCPRLLFTPPLPLLQDNIRSYISIYFPVIYATCCCYYYKKMIIFFNVVNTCGNKQWTLLIAKLEKRSFVSWNAWLNLDSQNLHLYRWYSVRHISEILFLYDKFLAISKQLKIIK